MQQIIDRRLAGDVDAMVGKCLEKDPNRRFPDAAALAALPLRVPGRPRDEQPTTRAAATRRRRAAAAATPRGPGRPKRTRRHCGLCDETGHDARNCPHKEKVS